ncbi:MAG: hypothetical protein JNL32_06355, partial [Candidatus Kapabacteria bacterium]|nr:hypothetical protein [Candidatus Kapabacteria bacterium]
MKHIFVTLALAIAAVILPPVTTTAQTMSGVINKYTSVSGYAAECGCLTVTSAKEFRSGDRVLVYQTQGATVLRSNDDLFGVVGNAGQSGVFEFATIASVNGNSITLFTQLTNTYDFTNGTVQLVKVATGSDVILGNVEAKQFDGASGGIIVIEASGTVSINGVINAQAKGFRGGLTALSNYTCGMRAYSYPAGSLQGAMKGEAVARYDAAVMNGRGAWANGGGGGNNHNAGGGGGGNAFTGGFGGYAWGNCPVKNDEQARGIGGFGLSYNARNPRMYFGGGGGAGHRNDNYNTTGGNGGGIVIIIADNINVNGGSILANGGSAARVELDGAGGGGAGGSVLLYANNISNALTVDVRGGNGGDARHVHGPGGGGSAGVVLIKQDQVPTGLTVIQHGGRSGMNYELGPNAAAYVQTPYGASNGENGAIISSVRINTASGASANPVIVKAEAPVSVCGNQTLTVKATVTGSNDVVYSWSGKGVNDTNASEINVRPTSTTTYTVRVQDARGCVAVDSVTVQVNAPVSVTAGNDRTMCTGGAVQLEAYTSGGNGTYTYAWTPAIGLNSAAIV